MNLRQTPNLGSLRRPAWILALAAAAAVLALLAEDGSPLAPGVVAEVLWRMAVKGRLSEPAAELAGGLLAHEDPFVRSLAEWAIPKPPKSFPEFINTVEASQVKISRGF